VEVIILIVGLEGYDAIEQAVGRVDPISSGADNDSRVRPIYDLLLDELSRVMGRIRHAMQRVEAAIAAMAERCLTTSEAQ
jgi:hypothetical protein